MALADPDHLTPTVSDEAGIFAPLTERDYEAGDPRQTREIVCWGELLWDVFADGPRLGGATANVAHHVAQLGGRALLVSRVGSDSLGRAALDALDRAGVDVSHVQVDPLRPTGTVEVSIVEGEPRYRIGQQVAWEGIELAEPLLPVLGRAAALCYGTLAQKTPIASAALGSALGLVSRHRVLDLNLRPGSMSEDAVRAGLRRATVVKLNDSEHRELARLLGNDDPAAALLESGVELVALTHGSDGAELRGRGVNVSHSGFPLEAVTGDSVGAGDAFTAVLVLGLVRGAPLHAILARANRHASLTASCRGGMPVVDAAWRARLDRDAPW